MLAWIRRQKYRAMLITLIAVMFAYPLFHDFDATRLFFDIVRAVFFFIALWIVFDDRRVRVLAFFIGAPSLIAVTAHTVFRESRPAAVELFFHGLSAIFFGLTATTILRKIYREKEITADSVYGAFCSYLLVGIIFGHIYCVLETLRPGSFRMADGQLPGFDPDGHGDYILIYYSLITISTVGYGDIIPANSSARSLATIEAVIGQFFMVVLMADLIGKRVSLFVDSRHSEDPEA